MLVPRLALLPAYRSQRTAKALNNLIPAVMARSVRIARGIVESIRVLIKTLRFIRVPPGRGTMVSRPVGTRVSIIDEAGRRPAIDGR